MFLHKLTCPYCGGNCPNEQDDSNYLCDGFAGDIDKLAEQEQESNMQIAMFRVCKDNVELRVFATESQCWYFIHENYSYSVSHAICYEGFSIEHRNTESDDWQPVPYTRETL